MPELPEVQTVIDTLAPRLLGRVLSRIVHIRSDVVKPAGIGLASLLRGKRVEALRRRGKRIIIQLNDGNHLFIHLGMTGRLTLEKPDAPLLGHTHLIVETGSGTSRFQLRFRDPRRFGCITWLGDALPEQGMGPEPLTLRRAQLAKRLARTTRAIKNALLDQRMVAGLGNIYVDESLFAARIHPLKRADMLSADEVSRLNRAIKLTLRRALRHRGSTLRDYVDANGESGAFQKLHRVYDRAGELCRACRTPIKRIALGGRSTCFCPRCQPSR